MPPLDPSAAARLRSISSFEDLVGYLESELDWPLGEYSFEELTYEYDPRDLDLRPELAARILSVRQLRPLYDAQPWGIFFVDFERKRLPIVVLRNLLSRLVVSQRQTVKVPDRAAWNAGDLLFITAFGEFLDGNNIDGAANANSGRELAFAHFHHEPGFGDLPTLRVLGWDGGDTVFKLDHLAHTIGQHLRWPRDTRDADAWRGAWRTPFRHRPGHVIRTAQDLAAHLADLARRIRDAARAKLAAETERGPLTRLHHAFRDALVHDLSATDFADTYAQTITYGLLTAAISRTEMSAGARGTALLAENVADLVPITNPFLKEMLQSFLAAGGRRGGLDFDELGVAEVVELLRGEDTDLPAVIRDFGNRHPGEDPVIHFYEDFLSAYDKPQKKLRGVFYTPQPVVSYIVRSVHELLQTEFGLADGLADTTTWGEMLKKHPGLKLPPLSDESGEKRTISPDEPFVQILDPATGTATFLVEVIEVIHRTLTTKWRQQRLTDAQQRAAWNDYVPQHLLPRLHAFELMMAPYAIAHMKIGLKLAETGYRFGTEERARIYLNNALEPWVKQLPLIGFDALAHEAAAVNEIKRHKRFTILIGNPPYAGISSNMSETAQRMVDAYRTVDGGALNERKLWLQDDYVKFMRRAQATIDCTGVGVFGFITNHGYLDNPTFRGMRQSLMTTYPQIRVLDLHGNANKREQDPKGSEDKNVFDIRQGVGICVATRGSAESLVEHADVWGSREVKYNWLDTHTVGDTVFGKLAPYSPFYFFKPQNVSLREEYNLGFKLTDAMPCFGLGFQSSRDHLVVGFSRGELEERIESFIAPQRPDADVRDAFFPGKIVANYLSGDTRQWSLSNARRVLQADRNWRKQIRQCLYRPFDFRMILYDKRMVDWPRPEVLGHMLKPNLCLLANRQSKEAFATFCADTLTERKIAAAYDASSSFPLYLQSDSDGLKLPTTRQPNFSYLFLGALATKLAVEQTKPYGLPTGLTPENIFHYAYAIFHSPGYRSRYAEFLKIDFPCLPLTGSPELFHALARLGGELTALHLLGSSRLDRPMSEFITEGGRGGPVPVQKVSWARDTVWVDKEQTAGFRGVPEAIWHFHIGGYQVCEKWLKDRRGRVLSPGDVTHYGKIVVALAETLRLMGDVDTVIARHGGWPCAFFTTGGGNASGGGDQV